MKFGRRMQRRQAAQIAAPAAQALQAGAEMQTRLDEAADLVALLTEMGHDTEANAVRAMIGDGYLELVEHYGKIADYADRISGAR